MKVISFILLLSIAIVSEAAPTSHSHGMRVHSHPLPVEGVRHSHGGGIIGSLATNGGGNTIVTTHGDKANIINQPNTVIINTRANNYSNKNLSNSVSKKQHNKTTQLNIVRHHKTVEIKLKSCNKRGKRITCKFVMKNIGKDVDFMFGGSSFLIDSDGEKYPAGLCVFGKKKLYSPIRKLLVTNIPVKGEMQFDNVISNSKVIPLLKIGVFPSHIEFRNVPLF